MGMIGKILKYIALLLFNILWYLQLLIPRNKMIWIFGAWFGNKYSDNAKVLYEYILENHKEIKAIWLTHNENIYRKLKNEAKPVAYIAGWKGIYLSLIAGMVIFSSGKKDVNQYFINGAKLVLTWHGAPMKKIGLDDKYAFNSLKFKILKFLFPVLWEYKLNAVVSTAELFNNKLCSAFNLKPNQILLSGYPRNDAFFSDKKSSLIEKYDKEFDNPFKIIYLPTFRDKQNSFLPFENYQFNISEWIDYLENTNSIFISKGHFVDKKIGEISSHKRIIHLSDDLIDDLNPFLKDIDLLITDYSGAYFDFLLAEKAILLAPFDLEEYISGSRELYFDYEKDIEGVKAENWDKVLQLLKQNIIISLI